MPDSELHSLPNGRSRGDLAPAPLPDAPGCRRCAWEPWAAPAASQRNRSARPPPKWPDKAGGKRKLLLFPQPGVCFEWNGNSITASHRSMGGETWAVQGRWGAVQVPLQLCRAQTTPQWVPARDGMPAFSSYFKTVLLGIWFFNLFSFAS